MASQMSEARFWDTAADIAAGPGLFKAKGQRLIFPGYLKVYGQEAGDEAKSLPPLATGQELRLLELKKEQKFTQPPPRYSEASLVRELEEKGIGRPSTYAAIISTLLDRDYARLEEKHFVPSELGETVSDLLAEHFVKIMDVGFTAAMEESLDAVAEGRADWVALLREFTDDFYPTLVKASKDMAKVKAGKETDVVCELCGKPMVIRFGKAGEFLGCSGYPECKNTKEFDRAADGAVIARERKPEEVAAVGTCPQCGKDLVLKKSRTGSRFIACTGWPECKYTKPFSTGVACPPRRLHRDARREEFQARQGVLCLRRLPPVRLRRLGLAHKRTLPSVRLQDPRAQKDPRRRIDQLPQQELPVQKKRGEQERRRRGIGQRRRRSVEEKKVEKASGGRGDDPPGPLDWGGRSVKAVLTLRDDPRAATPPFRLERRGKSGRSAETGRKGDLRPDRVGRAGWVGKDEEKSIAEALSGQDVATGRRQASRPRIAGTPGGRGLHRSDAHPRIARPGRSY